MTAFPTLLQSDPRWKNIKLGTGDRTIGQSGCLLTCIAMKVGASVHWPNTVTPADFNALLITAKAFAGSNLLLTKAAAALGLKVERKAFEHIDLEREQIFGIEYKPNHSSSGFSSADHFLCARLIDGTVHFRDPAKGYWMAPYTALVSGQLSYSGKPARLVETIILS